MGGWRLHLNCIGEKRASQPTVILEAGIGDFSVGWSLVQPGVASFARVCSYDRAGSGWSDLGPRPRTMHQIDSELHTLLEKAGERSPYVLVGHSYGGGLVRIYQSVYPADVVGMVLVDAVSDDPVRLGPDGKLVRSGDLATNKPIPPVKTSDPLRESDIPANIVTLIMSQSGPASAHANDPPRNKLPMDAQRMRTWTLAQLKHGASNDNPVEAEEFAQLRVARTATDHVLGDLPLIVLARGAGEDGARDEADHRSEQETLATLSRKGKLVIATRSGHHIPIDQPDLVVTAIRDVIGAVRP
jgi:pimeloyl-ACP methyl ester carboxylesterase